VGSVGYHVHPAQQFCPRIPPSTPAWFVVVRFRLFVPTAVVCIGFAFHNNPQAGLSGRFPTNEQRFQHDLNDPLFLQWISQQSQGANGKNRHPRYVQWDVTFDLAFAGQPLRPTTPRPELHFLRLPFRF